MTFIPTLYEVNGFWKKKPEKPFRADDFILIVIGSGVKRGELRLANGKVAFTTSGNPLSSYILLVPPGGSFDGTYVEKQMELVYFKFSCPTMTFDSLRSSLLLTMDDKSSVFFHMAKSLAVSEMSVIREDVRVCARCFWETSTYEWLRLPAQFAFQNMLTSMMVFPEGVFTSPSSSSPAVRLKELIDNAYDFDWKLKDMALHLKYSVKYLHREFLKEFKMTPKEYREKIRLQAMKQLITESKESLGEIAKRFKMKNQSHLTAYIKRETGKTPSELRTKQ